MPLLHTASAALSILSCISGDGVFLSLVGYGTASMGNFASVINGTIVWSAQVGVVSSSRFRFALRLLDVFARVPLGFFGLGDARTRFEVALFELGDAGVRLARARFEVALFELGDARVRLDFFGLVDARARDVAMIALSISSIARLDIGRQPN